jgi:hypothetical protein
MENTRANDLMMKMGDSLYKEVESSWRVWNRTMCMVFSLNFSTVIVLTSKKLFFSPTFSNEWNSLTKSSTLYRNFNRRNATRAFAKKLRKPVPHLQPLISGRNFRSQKLKYSTEHENSLHMFLGIVNCWRISTSIFIR